VGCFGGRCRPAFVYGGGSERENLLCLRFRRAEPNYFISKLTPEERVGPIARDKETGSYSQAVAGDPVYFSLRTPRRFDRATLILKYRRPKTTGSAAENLITAPVIEAGVLVDKTVWRHDLKPIDNQIINRLSRTWNIKEKNGLILLQRGKKYGSIDEFLNNLPPRNEIALYNYDLKTNFILKGYEPLKLGSEASRSLRGDWQFYTYIKNENLDFTFDFKDLNRNKDKDDIGLFLYHNGRLIDAAFCRIRVKTKAEAKS